MAIITWIDEYNVNIKVIDEQHQHLVNILNRISEVDIADEDKEKRQIRRVFAELADYMTYHFDTEEEILKAANYPYFQWHKQQHYELAKQLLELQISFSKGDSTVSVELLELLNHWLIDHILDSDKKYVPFLHSKSLF
ncbi:MAG: hemerythrin [Candidatus Parabeggiatoa sp. nov. 1]|nr:MAG: hemerythrin [Gammaproteobacteria bacterium]